MFRSCPSFNQFPSCIVIALLIIGVATSSACHHILKIVLITVVNYPLPMFINILIRLICQKKKKFALSSKSLELIRLRHRPSRNILQQYNIAVAMAISGGLIRLFFWMLVR